MNRGRQPAPPPPTTRCTVCEGERNYPIINNRGSTLYYIRCPHCYGTGIEPEPEPAKVER